MKHDPGVHLKPAASRNWMVIYTRSNWEKKSSQLLDAHGIKSYCPMIKIKKKWSDRLKTVELPLFKSYLFVYIAPGEQFKTLQVPGVMSFVKHCNNPVSIPSSEIERIETIIQSNNGIEVVNYRNASIGDRVIINTGPFSQKEAQVADIKGPSVLLVLEQLGCALIVKVNQNNISPLVTTIPN